MTKPSVVYLDSSDYSTLSDPKRDSRTEQLCGRLLGLAKRPSIMFVFSGAHISEMAPLEARHAESAVRRTELLTQLCGRNTLISLDRLILMELAQLAGHPSASHAIIDTNGQWFPELSQLITPVQKLDVQGVFDRQIADMNLNRKMRRHVQGSILKKGAFRAGLPFQFGIAELEKLLAEYPMRPKDAKVVANYVLGKASREQANDAFLQSLRDPDWMMRWFHSHADSLGAIGDWVRKPARNLVESLRQPLEQFTAMSVDEQSAAFKPITGEQWRKIRDHSTMTMVNDLLTKLIPGTESCTDVDKINSACPGLATCIRTLHASVRNALGARPRAPTNSDMVDALHALYVPYVDFFRGDRYMAPIIAGEAPQFSGRVFGQLPKLVDALEQQHARG
ncbi:hypothetical protein [Pseudomonas syringae]|uniref:hypothetical protein n=1 Tax=Pseudomonas syringae TaxID=317 RepID=UPI000709386D|nr:hypothetical protein [Pseudomonas syringae]KWS45739.1 hypothetical protein AL060_12295 [Pseudomonas syringae pv. rhaphiolepidis]